MSVVIDTNVAVVANGKHEVASDDCIERCIDALIAAQQGVVLVDDGFLIFDEYQRHLSHAGQPGVGDAFFKWLWSNQANPSHCRQVEITPIDPAGRVFQEFPDDPDLEKFDRDDRKFVAVALASGETPDILNASDTDWWTFRESLTRYGIQTQFLCQELMAD
ncbi:MAG: hypothetical protein QM741_05275 [Rudaea sp.]|uniref:hypothetical protein n=1 Tax=Rudaea sp. TaxID=2136325 RepID=UPI0039E28043